MFARIRTTPFVLTGLLFLAAAGAAGEPPPTGPSDAEIRRKLEEIERLKSQLYRAEQELRQLEQQRAARSPIAPQPTPAQTPPSSAKPTELTPIAAGTTLTVDDLAAQFRADPAGAQARYRKQTLRVRGVISRFETKVARRNYDVVLESADRAYPVVAGFEYLERYRAVYTRDHGQSLFARLGEREESALLRTGEVVLVQGRCLGLKDGAIQFDRCTVIED